MGVRLEIQLAAAPIGYVGVELCRRQIRVSEHFLNRPEVSAAFQEVRCKRVPQKVWMHALGLETGFPGELPEDQEGARPCERTALRVEEDLRPVPLVEVRPAACEVASQGLDGLPADRNDPIRARG